LQVRQCVGVVFDEKNAKWFIHRVRIIQWLTEWPTQRLSLLPNRNTKISDLRAVLRGFVARASKASSRVTVCWVIAHR
jgi:hypothetical protein